MLDKCLFLRVIKTYLFIIITVGSWLKRKKKQGSFVGRVKLTKRLRNNSLKGILLELCWLIKQQKNISFASFHLMHFTNESIKILFLTIHICTLNIDALSIFRNKKKKKERDAKYKSTECVKSVRFQLQRNFIKDIIILHVSLFTNRIQSLLSL